MMEKLTGWNDTIVALATPPGIGALGVIRLSGNQSFNIINHLFASKDVTKQPSHSLHVGILQFNGEMLDEVVVSLFRGPRSYTGEDVIEISCHGSPFILQQVIDACIQQGARLAKPGEFTQRAFLNGKLDLAQAEAVADLIASNTAAFHKTAMNNIRGGFSTTLKELRERLIKFAALIELELDFSQEDVEFADRTQFYQLITEAEKTTHELSDSFRLGNVIRNGISVAIIGKPNAGKSTLLNSLLNENRAIVSEIPGTTRDTVEEVINIDGVLFRLIDTAGIREHTPDSIESAGIEKSREKMRQADLVLYLFDINDTTTDELKKVEEEFKDQQFNYLMVANKIDAVDENDARKQLAALQKIIYISAKTKLHLDVLKGRMVDTVLQGGINAEDTIVTNARHFHALKQVENALADIHKGLDEKLPGDLLAPDIRRCLYYLGEITGEVSNEDMLDYIFSKFCIGK
jgi:tRNA modification GTPase